MRVYAFLLAGVFSGLVLSCATAPQLTRTYAPSELYSAVCEAGAQLQSAEGEIALRMRSDDLSGRFSAQVRVWAPESMRLEVTNLFGGTEAVISIRRNRYEIIRYREGESHEERKVSNWGGIPLILAYDLFLGKFPCPKLPSEGPNGSPNTSNEKNTRLRIEPNGNLVIEVRDRNESVTQEFIYSFIEYKDKPWPSSLHWTRREDKKSIFVNFQFDDPEKETLSPLKWEAQTATHEIKVRWKERKWLK